MEYNEKLDRTVRMFRDFLHSVEESAQSEAEKKNKPKRTMVSGGYIRADNVVGKVGMSMRKAKKNMHPHNYVQAGDIIQGGYIQTDHVASLTPKHKWTKEQRAEARAISYRLLVGNPSPESSGWNHLLFPLISFNRVTGETKASVGVGKTARAKCQPNDEYNYDIGIMVAMCKLYGHRLPDWIHGKVVD